MVENLSDNNLKNVREDESTFLMRQEEGTTKIPAGSLSSSKYIVPTNASIQENKTTSASTVVIEKIILFSSLAYWNNDHHQRWPLHETLMSGCLIILKYFQTPLC